MSNYIIEKKANSHTWLAWLSVALLVANVYHTKLIQLFLPYFSVGAIAVLLVISTGLLLLYFITESKINITELRFTETDIMMLLCIVVILVTSGFDFENITYLVRFALLFILVFLMKYDEKLIKIIIVCVVVASFIHVAASLFLHFDKDFYLQYIYPTFDADTRANLYSWNILNGYATGLTDHFSANGVLISIAVITNSVLMYRNKKKYKWILSVLTFVSLITLFMTGKRAPLVYTSFAIASTYLLCNQSSILTKLSISLVSVLGGIIVLFFAAQNIESIGSTLERFTAFFNENESYDVSNGRFKLYGIAWDYFLSAPVFGIGWREFSKRVVVFFHEDTSFRDAHNVFLQLLCETGIVGFLIFTTFFVIAFALTIRLVIRYRRGEIALSETEKLGLILSVCSQIYFLCYCMTGNPLYDTFMLYLYMFSVGIVSYISFQHEKLPALKKKQAERLPSRYIK